MMITNRFAVLALLVAAAGCSGSNGKNGAAGTSMLVSTSAVAAGTDCPAGGVSITTGIDANNNKTLEATEVTATQILCNGGAGTNGHQSLVATTDVPPDATCLLGGTRVDAGLDLNDNGKLEPGEISATQVLCSTQASAFSGLVFTGRTHFAGSLELFAVGADGLGLRKLDGTQDSLKSISNFKVSPDRHWVAFSASQNTGYAIELFVASLIDDRPPVAVSGPLTIGVAGLSNNSYAWAPDSSRLAYLSDTGTGVRELYSVFPDGSGRVKLNGAIVAGGAIASYAWAPDSSRVAYIADANVLTTNELYTVLPNGTGLVRLTSTLALGRVVASLAWAPDSSRIAYLADQTTAAINELYSITPADGVGTSMVKLNNALVATGKVVNYAWAPNSTFVVYRADGGTAGVYELYRVNAAGGGYINLNGALVAGTTVQIPNAYSSSWVSPDSSRVAYLVGPVASSKELYTVAADGSGRVKINPTLVAGGDVYAFVWSPGSTRLVAVADAETNGVFEVYTSPAAGGGWVKVSAAPIAGGQSAGAVPLYMASSLPNAWAPDSSRLAYLADNVTVGVPETYTVAPDGTGGVKVSGALPAGGLTLLPQWAPDGKRLAYFGYLVTAGIADVATVRPDGSGFQIVSANQLGNGVGSFTW